MANTIRASKNTFSGGLVMDLAPDTTPNEVLTSALNATLVTFNGNELSLQNDMGNGRVETARLPDGYIPVGTCEFGDIIYIVSYNPLTNKSLIGCFPSPERNISSEEIGSTGQQLSADDFLVLDGGNPTGELVANSVKKVLYENKLNPGDKFIIYDTNNTIIGQTNITDIGNTSHDYGMFPKMLRIHVIAIEDDGRINYLDSTLKWYDDVKYFILNQGSGVGGKGIDIDAYRNMLSSGYSVFLSKISGKLALLVELEKISGFSCAYSVYGGGETDGDTIYKDYKVFWNFSWNTDDNNINPSYVILTKSEWSGKDSNKKGTWISWNTNHIALVNSYEGVLPVAYPDSGYKEWEIEGIDTSRTYEDFITTYSYQKILETWFATINSDDIYKDLPLVKLNIEKENKDNYKLIPNVGHYYINADMIIYNNSTSEGESEEETEEVSITSLVYTRSSNDGSYQSISSKEIKDIIVNNYFQYPIYREFAEFSIPVSLKVKDTLNNDVVVSTDITNLIYHYEVTPAMAYGLLREYSIEGYIDFSKIGTGTIDMNVWKYFVGDNIMSLTIGLDAYVEENKGIDEVVLEFYDNLGMAAAYHMGNKESYSGQFTENIPLNNKVSSYKLQAIDSKGITHIHCGIPASEDDTDVVYINDENNPSPTKLEGEKVSGTTYYLDDCGTIYSNMLYLVKIVVKYCPKDALDGLDISDNSDYRYFYRWVWTNGIFNNEYYNVLDFDNLNITLTLDANPIYEITDDYSYKTFSYSAPTSESATGGSDSVYKGISAAVQLITDIGSMPIEELEEEETEEEIEGGSEGEEGEESETKYNTRLSLIVGLNNDYGVFNLRKNGEGETGDDAYDQIQVDIITDGGIYVENSEATIMHAGDSQQREFKGILPVLSEEDGSIDWKDDEYGPNLIEKIGGYIGQTSSVADLDIYSCADCYKHYKNQFKVDFKDTSSEVESSDKEYIDYQLNALEVVGHHVITKTLSEISGEEDNFVYLNSTIIHFSKYYGIYKEGTNSHTPMLVPLLYDKTDLDKYGLGLPESGSIPYIKTFLHFKWYYGGSGARDEDSYIYYSFLNYIEGSNGYNISGTSLYYYHNNYGERDFSMFKTNHKGYITHRKDREAEWTENIPKGFFLFGMEDESSTGFTFNGGDEGGFNLLDYTFPNQYMLYWNVSANWNKYNIDEPTSDGGKLSDGTNPIIGIGYYCDELENLRLFNTYFPMIKSDTGTGTYITQQPKYKTNPPLKKPQYVGLMLASLLTSLYSYRETTITYPYKSDVVYLDENYTTYTKDIVYCIKSNAEDNNEILLFKGCKFSQYLTQVLNNFTSEELGEVSSNNTDIRLKECVKNVPLLYKLNYILPETEGIGDENNQALIKFIDGTEEVLTGDAPIIDKLYYIKSEDGKYRILGIDDKFTIKYLKSISIQDSIIRGEYDETINEENNPYICKMFEINNSELAFQKSDLLNTSVPTYSIVTNFHKDCCLHHLPKRDVIIPFAKVF